MNDKRRGIGRDEENKRYILCFQISGLVNWNEDSRNKFRFKAQVLFERLLRKFG